MQARFLGERTVTAQGEAGPYEWMTFKEVQAGLTDCPPDADQTMCDWKQSLCILLTSICII